MRREVCKFLYDVRLACEALLEFTLNKSQADYEADSLLRSGVERQFEIIGKALNQAMKIETTLEGNITSIRQIISLRNAIIHGYAEIENETIWGILQNELPVLYEQV